MHNISRLTELIKKIAVNTINSMKLTSIMYGEVVSESPLRVQIDPKLTLGENQLVLTRNVTDYTTRISINNNEELAQPQWIFNRLKIGENVVLIRFTGGQKYLLIDRLVI